MATYKVWLTVKDRYGNIKKVDSGNIDIGISGLTEKDFEAIEEALPLEDYVAKAELDDLLVDSKSPVYVPDLTSDNRLVFNLEKNATEERLEFDIDKSNDWNNLDGTRGSSYVWEPIQ